MMEKPIKTALKALGVARDALIEEIRALDIRLGALRADRSKLTSDPVSKADFLGYLKADIAKKAQRFEVQLTRKLGAISKDYGNLNRSYPNPSGLGFDYLALHALPVVITEEAIYFYFGATLLERLNTALDGLDWPGGEIPVDERARLIGLLDTEIAELSAQRDELAFQMRGAGLAG